MAKPQEKNRALKLRKQGKSLKEISEEIGVGKSTISLWCRDIELSPTQIKRLRKKMNEGGYIGARAQYRRRLERIKRGKEWGDKRISNLSHRDLFLSGLSLYWGEGSKKTRQVRVSNSDPAVINFMIRWFKDIWGVRDERFAIRIGINVAHKGRVKEVEKYWSKVTGIPMEQIRKTTLIRSKSKKNYKNFYEHYGTVRLEVRKPAELYYKIMGSIDALSNVKPV